MLLHLLLFLFSFSLCAREPLSEDVWDSFADWTLSLRETFDPSKVQLGDVILIKDLEGTLWKVLALFEEEYLPQISHPFILLTPRTDLCLPGRFAHLLKETKIRTWFVQNIDCPPTEKIQPIPIGLASARWRNPSLLEQIPSREKKDFFLYVNFAETSPTRKKCWKACKKIKQATLYQRPVAYETYVEHLSRALFVASPHGNGPDCHRTWEALLMGCYPIVQSSPLNPLFEGLPILIVDDWKDLNCELLDRKRQEFEKLSWSKEKLYTPYWFEKIRDLQKILREPLQKTNELFTLEGI